MAPLNSGYSTYHSIQALYWRRADFSLASVSGTWAAHLSEQWPHFREQLAAAALRPNTSGRHAAFTLPSGTRVTTAQVTLQSSAYCVRELHQPRYGGCVLGLVSLSKPDPAEIDAWAELFVLCETMLLRPPKKSVSSPLEDKATARRIADLFDKHLRNVSPNDKWSTGRQIFEARVLEWVTLRMPVHFCLPAFPCKSPNPEKTNSVDPDRAEYLALTALKEFVRRVGEVYKPGAFIMLVTDGHVFSDCLGVSDDNIDTYYENLKDMYDRTVSDNTVCDKDGFKRFQFITLKQLFHSNWEVESLFKQSWIQNLDLPHPVESERSASAEWCRKLLMALGQPDRNVLRDLIKNQDPSTISLYRGLSRFMLEDLAHDKSSAGFSVSKRKKIASAVAAEMIIRNCAYSNLVELLFPSHVRLSIHAHDNSGPKFAIRLLRNVRVVEDLQSRHARISVDGHHTPTPWHNCLAYIEGESVPYLIKSSAAHEAIAEGSFEGSWKDSETGGYFALRPKSVSVKDPEAVVDGDAAVEKAKANPAPEAKQENLPPVRRWRIFPLLHLPFAWTFDCILMVGRLCKAWVPR